MSLLEKSQVSIELGSVDNVICKLRFLDFALIYEINGFHLKLL